jgi:hypothetical protein
MGLHGGDFCPHGTPDQEKNWPVGWENGSPAPESFHEGMNHPSPGPPSMHGWLSPQKNASSIAL